MALRLVLLDAQAAWSWVGKWRRPPPGKRTGQGKEQRGADEQVPVSLVLRRTVPCVRRLEPGLLLPVQAVLHSSWTKRFVCTPSRVCPFLFVGVCFSCIILEVIYVCMRAGEGDKATREEREASFLSFVPSCPISWGARQSLTKQRANSGHITTHQPGPCSRPANK